MLFHKPEAFAKAELAVLRVNKNHEHFTADTHTVERRATVVRKATLSHLRKEERIFCHVYPQCHEYCAVSHHLLLRNL